MNMPVENPLKDAVGFLEGVEGAKFHYPHGFIRQDAQGTPVNQDTTANRHLICRLLRKVALQMREKYPGKQGERIGQQTLLLHAAAPNHAEPEDAARLADQKQLAYALALDEAYMRLEAALQRPEVQLIHRPDGHRDGSVNLRQLHRRLPNALFLHDGTPILDGAWAPRTQIYRSTAHQLIGMGAWLLQDHRKAIKGNELPVHLRWQGQQFALDAALGQEASLWTHGQQETLRRLRLCLNDAYKRNPVRLPALQSVAAAIDDVLSTAQHKGSRWRVQNFHWIWEILCIEWYKKERTDQAGTLYSADDPRGVADQRQKIHKIFKENQKKRRPDLVICSAPENGKHRVERIVDFKYYDSIEKVDRDEIDKYDTSRILSAALDRLEAYWFLATLHNMETCGQQKRDDPQIELGFWMPGLPGSKPEMCPQMLRPGFTLCWLDTRQLIEHYVQTD